MANALGDSVTEFAAARGALIQNLSGGAYGFDFRDAEVFDGTHMWVANYSGNSVSDVTAG